MYTGWLVPAALIHTHTRLFTPCFTCTAYTQEPNHNGGAQEDQEDKGTTVYTLPIQEDKGTTVHTLPIQEDKGTTAHTLSTQEGKGTTVHTLPIQEDKGTTAHTLSTQEDKGTTAHTLPTQEAASITHHTNSLASNEPPDIAPVDIVIYPKPFHKFSQGYMETLTDVGLTNSDRLARYVQLLERLLAHAYFIPTNRIQIVVDTVLKVSNKQVLYRFHSLLCQDLKLRPSGTTNLPVDYLQDTLHTISHKLSFTPTHLPSRIVLHYIALLKPLLSSSLTTKLLDMAISTLCVPPLDSLPSPTQAALSLMASHSLPGDLAARIQQLTSYTDKHQLLRCIPQLDLRLKVVEVILSQSFHGDHDNQPTPNTSLEEICQRHFTRRPYRPNGDPHDLCYFLSLLLLLVETWLLLHHPPQCVGINHPPPETPPPSVQCVGHAVDLLTSRLLDDAFLTDELCSPNVWHQLQLLKAFSN